MVSVANQEESCRISMLYSEWVDRVWLAVGEYWLELDDNGRRLGVPCDEDLLERIGVRAGQETGNAVRAVYDALKGLESIAQVLEVTPRHFRLIDSAPHRAGRSLIPLFEHLSRQPVEQNELAFLEQLVRMALSWSPASPEGELSSYPVVTSREVATVFRALGWDWVRPIDPHALEITYSLKTLGLLATSYAEKVFVCAPTLKGILRAEDRMP